MGLLASARSVLLGGGVFLFENLLGNWPLVPISLWQLVRPRLSNRKWARSNKQMQLFEGAFGDILLWDAVAMALMGTYQGAFGPDL